MGEAPDVACPLFPSCPVGPDHCSLVPFLGIAGLMAH